MGDYSLLRRPRGSWLEASLLQKMEGGLGVSLRSTIIENAITRLANSYFKLSLINDETGLLASKQEILYLYGKRENTAAASFFEEKLSTKMREFGASALDAKFYGTMLSWSRMHRSLSSGGAGGAARMASQLAYSNAGISSRIDERLDTYEDLQDFFREGSASLAAPHSPLLEVAKIMVPFCREASVPMQKLGGGLYSISLNAIDHVARQ